MAHSHATVSAALAEQIDPTQTSVLRERRFKPALTEPYRGVRGAVRTTIEENDALGITERREWQQARQRQLAEQEQAWAQMEWTAALAADDISPRERFRESDDAARQEAFLQWLDDALETAVLEPMTMREVRDGQHYSAEYIREAYLKGIRDGAKQLREFDQNPETEDVPQEPPESGSDAIYAAATAVALGALFQRTYSAIKGTVTTAQKDTRRVFDEYYPQASKARLTSEVNNAIEDGGESDAIDVARSEPIYAYAEGQLDQFEAHDIAEIGVEPEVHLSTAGDSAVCSRCRRQAQRGPFTIDEVRRNPTRLHPPLHPSCRCRLVIFG